MKKTLTVNLGGTVFHIDEDAYRLLDNYLCNLKLHFRKQVGANEIVDDIELRLSELFSEKQIAGSQVITIADVEEVITRMGKPEEMEADSEENFSAEGSKAGYGAGSWNSDDRSSYNTAQRRLYRNPDDRMLGGVIGGVAVYMGWDITWSRLIFVFCAILGFKLLIPLYIICWIVIPEARTAAEKLNMRGEPVTVENIGKTVTGGFERMANNVNDYVKSGTPRTVLQKIGDTLLMIVGWFLKICLMIFAIVFSPVLLVFGIVFVVLFFAAIVIAINGAPTLFALFPAIDFVIPTSPLSAIVMYIAGILIVGIPLISIIFAILRPMLNWQPMVSGLKWTLLILWIVSTAVFFICFMMQGFTFPQLLMQV